MNLSAPLRRGALMLLAALLVGIIAACSSASPTPGGAAATVVNGTVEIDADDLEFNAGMIEAPAGEPFTIVFNNLEDVPHNLSVYREQGGERLVEGEIVTGPDATAQVEVPALDPGQYFFVCELHADQMSGTIVVE